MSQPGQTDFLLFLSCGSRSCSSFVLLDLNGEEMGLDRVRALWVRVAWLRMRGFSVRGLEIWRGRFVAMLRGEFEVERSV